MKFPEKYIKHGNFILHSGQTSDIFYDVNALLTDNFYLRYLLDEVPRSKHYVGIVTGGALIAIIAHIHHGRFPGSKFSMIKDGELKGEIPDRDWTLIDDVVTTGNSLLEAIITAGSKPKNIFVVVDRRERNENPEVNSIFEP